MTELTFTPATITRTDRTPLTDDIQWMLTLDKENVEWDIDADDNLVIGVPANHHSVFTIGPYTITLDR